MIAAMEIRPTTALEISLVTVAIMVGFIFLIKWLIDISIGKQRELKHDNNFLRGTIKKIESDLVLADQDDINVQNALSRIYGLREDAE